MLGRVAMQYIQKALEHGVNFVIIVSRNCGEMAATDSTYRKSSVCANGASILYAWAMDAPPLTLPEGKA